MGDAGVVMMMVVVVVVMMMMVVMMMNIMVVLAVIGRGFRPSECYEGVQAALNGSIVE